MDDDTGIDKIVSEILFFMPFREKSIIANMDEDALPYLQYAFDRYISEKFPDDDGGGKELMRRLWEACRETHGLKLVKGKQ